MRTRLLLLGIATLALAGCSTRSVNGIPVPRRSGDVVVVDDDGGSRARRTPARGPRALRGVPPGHYPPPGECRLWYAGRPPGKQPPPTKCSSLRGRVPAGAFVLYNEKAWDADYDWRAAERRKPGSVPRAVLELVGAARRG